MKKINSLLSRFAGLLDKKTAIKETVALVISKSINKEVSPGCIFVSESVLEIEVSPTVKNEIKLKEQSILEELEGSHKLFFNRVLYR